MKSGVVFEAKTKKYHLRYRESLTWAAKMNRHSPTKAESKIWYEFLRKRPEGHKFTRQKPLDRFILDFYCSELLLVIEIDGV
jgi:very-short-patch-repair endonuclease